MTLMKIEVNCCSAVNYGAAAVLLKQRGIIVKRLRRRRKSEDEETSYWLSYSDMMAGLLLIFVLIISFTMMQAKSQYEAKEEELAEQAAVIFSQQTDLSDKEAQLAEQESLLSNQQSLLTDQQSQLDEQKSALETLQELLANQEALLADKEALVSSQQELLSSQQAQLDKVIGIKADIIEALKDEFADTDLKLSVDSKTGAIALDSSVLFDTDEYELTESGAELLRQFVSRYVSVLMSDQFKDYVSEIIIEGHTDTNGTYLHNLELSQQRALAVASFCMDEENGVLGYEQIESLHSILTANGKAYSDPVYDANGNVDMDASRRVEFKFRLNDEDMVQQMIEILSDDSATAQTTDDTAAEE